MRTTVRIDDDLLPVLKERALREGISLAKAINNTLRRAIGDTGQKVQRREPYREKTYPMGVPKVPLTKALDVAAWLADEEMLKKMKMSREK
jgi:hypothetical protein